MPDFNDRNTACTIHAMIWKKIDKWNVLGVRWHFVSYISCKYRKSKSIFNCICITYELITCNYHFRNECDPTLSQTDTCTGIKVNWHNTKVIIQWKKVLDRQISHYYIW